MSSLETSAMRRSRSDLLAVETADFAASSHETELVPITSRTRYTPSLELFLAMVCSPIVCLPAGHAGLAAGLEASYARRGQPVHALLARLFLIGGDKAYAEAAMRYRPPGASYQVEAPPSSGAPGHDRNAEQE